MTFVHGTHTPTQIPQTGSSGHPVSSAKRPSGEGNLACGCQCARIVPRWDALTARGGISQPAPHGGISAVSGIPN